MAFDKEHHERDDGDDGRHNYDMIYHLANRTVRHLGEFTVENGLCPECSYLALSEVALASAIVNIMQTPNPSEKDIDRVVEHLREKVKEFIANGVWEVDINDAE